jgi:hypothetical protein
MPANESIDLKSPGKDITCKASATVTGKRFLRFSGNRTGGGTAALGTDLNNVPQVAPCNGSTQVPVGVAAYDAANGSLVPLKSGSGRHVTVTAGAAVTAGVQVMADSVGKAITYVGPVTTTTVALPSVPVVCGVAVTGASADGDDLEVRLVI